MKAIKRKISLFLAGLMVASAVSVMPTRAEGTTTVPTNVKFFNAHREVIAGDEMGVFITSEAEGQVQYKVWFYDAEGNWTETEYSEAVDPSVPYYMELPETFKEGQNTISVWVKRADVDVTETEHYKEDVKSGYDTFHYNHLYADKEGFSAGEKIDYTMNGKTVTINSVTGVEEGSEFKVYFYDYANSKWGEISTEWSGEPVEYTFEEEGYYLLDVQINKPESDEKYDALRMEVINVTENASATVAVTTSVDKLMFGANVTVTADNDGVATYQIFTKVGENMEALHDDKVVVGEVAEDLFPAEEGQEVTIKFFDAEGTFVGEVNTELGKEASFKIEKEEEIELKDFVAVATLEKLMFGGNVTVTCEAEEVATYQIFTKVGEDMEALHDDKVVVGETAKDLFPVEADQEVLVKFFNAEGTLLGQSETTLVK
ncbi:hypothetical protein [Oceanirhabdus seepicola]|uniref:Ig-like domain-containing protein n=1 Tax=Oceanirhabdus seepicola TaxID=2828781 RepID=A0A9J6P0M4_9CLOT|nr:hypothetical protein [Oceanirhabdus seepicola]MCM1990258.1 hypothetical protein [Oceanirhabdus seepicola]